MSQTRMRRIYAEYELHRVLIWNFATHFIIKVMFSFGN